MSSESAEHSSNVSSPRVRGLVQPDADALDALIAARIDASAAARPDHVNAERAQRVAQVLSLLEALPAAEPDAALVDRTLARIEAARQRERFAAQVQMLAGPESLSPAGGWRQVASVAAIVIVGLSLLMPFMERNRSEANRLACASNLSAAGVAFATYANDHNGVLPRHRVQPGAVWWNVGQAPASADEAVTSNSAHLYILVKNSLVTADQLACPNNPYAPWGQMTDQHSDWPSARAVSFSYQNQSTAEPIRLSRNNRLAVLADKNPLFIMGDNGMMFDDATRRDAPSRAHGNRGQNVLFADTTVRWTVRPIFDRANAVQDNIWVASGNHRKYQGTEQPASPDDSFLVP